jgi:signal transduction histidine kinase
MRRMLLPVVAALAVLAAGAALVAHAWSERIEARNARWETIRLRARTAAGEAARAVEDRFAAILEAENRRPFYVYQHFYVPPEALAAQFVLQESPLAGHPEPMIDLWFEILPDGTLALPAEPPDGPRDEPARRRVLAEVLPELLGRVRAEPRPPAAAASLAESPAPIAAAPPLPEPRPDPEPPRRPQQARSADRPRLPSNTRSGGTNLANEPARTPPANAVDGADAEDRATAAETGDAAPPNVPTANPASPSQVTRMPRWTVEGNERAGDIARQIEFANAGDPRAQQQLQSDYNLMRGFQNTTAPAAADTPPPAGSNPLESPGDASGPDNSSAAALPAAESASDPPGPDISSPGAPAPAESSIDPPGPEPGSRPAATVPVRHPPSPAVRPPAAESPRPRLVEQDAASAEHAAPDPPTQDDPADTTFEPPIAESPTAGGVVDPLLPTANPGDEPVDVIYGSFEAVPGPAGRFWFARTVSIEGNVRVQGFRLRPEGPSTMAADAVRSVARAHEGLTIEAGGTVDPRAGRPLAEVAVRGVPGIETARASLLPGAPAITAEDAADRRVTRVLAALSAAIVLAVLFSFLAARREMELARRKGEFMSAVSHELRAPVTTIRLYAEMLRDGWVGEGDRRAEYEGAIVSEAERLSRLVENVLSYARRDRGKPLSFRDGDLAERVGEVVRLEQPVIEKAGLSIACDLPESLPWRFDPDAVAQILLNLLENAAKHAKGAENRRIEVRLGRNDDQALIEVRDHGVGIPAEEQRRIFEPFYRVGSELTRTTRGAGLGLALVRRLARAHGGNVSVHSRPGEGATFTVRLGRPKT